MTVISGKVKSFMVVQADPTLQVDPNSKDVMDYRRNHVGRLNTNANDPGALAESDMNGNPDDKNHDGYTDIEDKSSFLAEELALSAADRIELTKFVEEPEHSGRFKNCFDRMTTRESQTLQEKKDALATAEHLSGKDSIIARNAKLDLAIEKARIIEAHGTPEQRAWAEKMELKAQREQVVLGKAQLEMQGKTPEEAAAIEKAALKSLPPAHLRNGSPSGGLDQKGSLPALFAFALLQTTPFGSRNASNPIATILPQLFAPGGGPN